MSTPISHGQQTSNTTTTQSSGGNKTTKQMGDFLQANDYVSKFAFIILVVIVFIGIYNLGIIILQFIFGPKKDIYLTKGLEDGTQYKMIPQDPSNQNSITVNRSVNEKQGIAFTWSIWLYIKPNSTKVNHELLHVFHKGNNNIPDDDDDTTKYPEYLSGMNWPNNAPGLYIDCKMPHANDDGDYENGQYKFVVVMNTFENIIENITVPDIPLNKWTNVIIRCQQTSLDVYINGTVVKRHELGDVPKQNYGNVYMSANGGFNGYSSQLRYFGSALQPGKIMDIVKSGPHTKVSGDNPTAQSGSVNPPYLAMRWYFDENNIPPGGGQDDSN